MVRVDNVVYGPPELIGPHDISYSEYMFKRLKKGGNRIAQIHNVTGKSVTYLEILQKCVNVATSLRKLGIRKDDSIGLCCENRFEFTECAIGTMFAGAVNATLNTTYTVDELKHAMKISKPKIVFCSKLNIQNLLEAVTTTPSVRHVITLDDPIKNVLTYKEFLSENINIDEFKVEEVDIHDPLAIMCSSGTTGLPKGVVLTHHNFVICNGHLRKMFQHMTPIKKQCLLSLLPWFHAYGFITHVGSLNVHLRYVFMTKFEEIPFLQAIQNYKITLIFLVPPLMVFLAKHPLVDKYDLSSLNQLWCGAAPLSKELQIAVTNRIHVKHIHQGYGLSETTLAVLHSCIAPVNKYGSCGIVMPGTMIKVIDLTTGEALGPNQEGELCFKGPLMMKGYLGDAASTNDIFDSEQWMHSGDIGYYDEGEFFYIVDRLKELIKFKGFQVPPAELEAILLEHPEVKDVGVIGKPDESAGELPIAFVVRQPSSNISEKELVNYVAEKVSYHKRLHGGIIFTDVIPKNPSGKILRKELRKLIKVNTKSKL